MESKLSVIIPIYNVEPYLRQCLDSVVNQTYRNLEIILIDDGSPDNCGAICDEYADKDNRIVVIHKENRGLSAARNDGIRKATGDWITFVDSDDWCELDYYEQMFMELGTSNVDVFCAGGHIREESGVGIKKYNIIYMPRIFEMEETRKLLPYVLCLGEKPSRKERETLCLPWDKFYRTVFLREKHLYFDENVKAWEDVLYNFKVFFKANAVGSSVCIGYHYRQVSTSIAHRFNPTKPKANYGFVTELYNFIENNNLKDEFICSAAETVTLATIRNSLNCYYYHPSNNKPYAEISRELAEMTKWPLYHEVLCDNDNRYLTLKRIILKYILRYKLFRLISLRNNLKERWTALHKTET